MNVNYSQLNNYLRMGVFQPDLSGHIKHKIKYSNKLMFNNIQIKYWLSSKTYMSGEKDYNNCDEYRYDESELPGLR